MGRMSEHERDARDLRILAALDQGLTQAAVCARFGVSRGLIVTLLMDIRKDEAA